MTAEEDTMATSPGSRDATPSERPPAFRFGVLGPLEVRSGTFPVNVGPLKQRVALAILLCHGNKVVPVGDLSDAIWGIDAPRTALKNLQVYISRLRAILFPGDGAERLAYRFPGYQIQVTAPELDLLAYEQLVRSGRACARQGDIKKAASTLRDALRLWRGVALADLAILPGIGPEAARLDTHRVAVYEDWAEAELQLGNYALVLEEIDEIVRRHPMRERLRRVQLLALSRSGRHVEALAEYDDLRVSLSRDFGLEPSAALQHLYQAILTGDPSVRPLGEAVLLSGGMRDVLAHTAQLPRDIDDFTGRRTELDELVTTMRQADLDGVKVAVLGGPPGVGKTALAVRAAHQLRRSFADGQLLMSMHTPGGRPRTALDVLGQLLRMAGLEGTPPRQLEERAALYRAFMAERSLLLLFDDVSDPAVVRWLLPGTGGSGVLITSRRRLVALEATHHFHVGPFSDGEAITLLARMIGDRRVEAERDAAKLIAARCGGLPQAIRIAGTKLRLQPHLPLAQLAARLADEREMLDTLEVGGLSVRRCAEVYSDELPARDWADLRAIGLLPSPKFSLDDIAAILDRRGRKAEQLLDVMLEYHAVEATGDGWFEMPLWLHAHLAQLASEERLAPLTPRTLAAARYSRFLTWNAVRPGYLLRISAQYPAMCGVAKLLPVQRTVLPLSQATSTLTPWAKNSTGGTGL
jgi:DNA-binding SARP family transcriptional activator